MLYLSHPIPAVTRRHHRLRGTISLSIRGALSRIESSCRFTPFPTMLLQPRLASVRRPLSRLMVKHPDQSSKYGRKALNIPTSATARLANCGCRPVCAGGLGMTVRTASRSWDALTGCSAVVKWASGISKPVPVLIKVVMPRQEPLRACQHRHYFITGAEPVNG
jgi:hypothetical protein